MAGALRADVEVTDISVLFEMLASVRLGDKQRTSALRQRFLRLVLTGLRAGSKDALPSTGPDWDDL